MLVDTLSSPAWTKAPLAHAGTVGSRKLAREIASRVGDVGSFGAGVALRHSSPDRAVWPSSARLPVRSYLTFVHSQLNVRAAVVGLDSVARPPHNMPVFLVACEKRGAASRHRGATIDSAEQCPGGGGE